ncbi:MAG: peptidylprolyl isomerase [Chryseobacterium sp.]|nr:MAG: peptidylprolyl isomerase [Chryseobacterium sp.]
MDISELLGNIGTTEEKDKVSYSAGVVLAMSLKDMGFDEVSYDDFAEGMKSVFTNSFTKISPKKAIDIFNNYIAILREDLKSQNQEKGMVFLEENSKKPNIYTLPNGLQYEILREGNGEIPSIIDEVEVEYEGTLLDKQVFDSTKDIGPQTFAVSEVIKGWQDALTMMQEGARWRIFLPPHLAYGENGAPPMIQPNATLTFVIELNKILKI